MYAPANGYVSRIKVSQYGFGKAMYIKHPNGYTTVYAHLKEFEASIQKYVKKFNTKKRTIIQVTYFLSKKSFL
ncbi:M23 family metallopeptidase [Tenacibaculum retecalamus]|uniref:M23 family metallopeptidase n=1 Tax=Tenacibaculum retecalamus TaxID=3018315 RepID=UPI0023D9479E|nr:M23 family metallopeptidase [Tenacibaculum retecalamus]WBX72490.1 M23 family metallopeptidase [Tenacibaculum retecalamus]